MFCVSAYFSTERETRRALSESRLVTCPRWTPVAFAAEGPVRLMKPRTTEARGADPAHAPGLHGAWSRAW